MCRGPASSCFLMTFLHHHQRGVFLGGFWSLEGLFLYLPLNHPQPQQSKGPSDLPGEGQDQSISTAQV